MIGTTMTVRISPAVKTLSAGRLRGPKIGRKPNMLCSERLDVACTNGAEHDDTPEAEDHARDRRQHLDQRADDRPHAAAARASPDRGAIATASGVAMSSAITEVTAVP